MGKKSGNHGGEEGRARAFLLKVAMHCNCQGCIEKIRAAVKDITLLQGIESWDQSALESKGELKLVATADPEKLRRRLHKATRKNVDLVLVTKQQDKANKPGKADAAAAQALLLDSLQHQGQYAGQHNAAWANHLLPGAGYSSYPWAVQPDPYAAYAAGAYAYPPAQLGHGGAWHGHGY